MRIHARFGAAAAATALGAATVLTGAGLANAQELPDPTYTSASELGIERNADDEIVISYSNESDRDLYCVALIGEADLISAYYDAIRSVDLDFTGEQEMPEDLEAAYEDALEAGTLGSAMFGVEAGADGLVSPLADLPGLPIGTDLPTPTDTSFTPEALSICMAGDEESGEIDYIEIETTTSTGVLPGAGGSAELFGSLGSSGS